MKGKNCESTVEEDIQSDPELKQSLLQAKQDIADGNVYSKVIEELIELAKEMYQSYKRGEETGLIKEEVAFYDALASHDTAEEVMGDEILQAIAHELSKAIKANMSIDWNLRESARAKMRITVRRLLKKYGYPPDLQKMAVETVVKQAELMARNESI